MPHTLGIVGALAVISTNAVAVYCSIIFIKRLDGSPTPTDDRGRGPVAGVASLSTEETSQSTIMKSAVLAGVLTSLPALGIGLFALALKRKLEKREEDDVWVVV